MYFWYSYKAKANYKGLNLRKIGISDVVIASVHSEKTRLKNMIIIIINKSQELTVFHGHQKLTSTKNYRPEK